MSPNRSGPVIGALFGLVYVEVNAAQLSSPVSLVLQVLGAVAFLVVLWGSLRGHAPDSTAPRDAGGFGAGYWLIVVAEVAAFAAGSALLNGPLDLPEGVLGWVSFIVGVHFLGLARIWDEPSLAWLGGGIAVLGVLGLGLAAAGASDAAVAAPAGVGPGALLLAGSIWAVLGKRPDAGPGSQARHYP